MVLNLANKSELLNTNTTNEVYVLNLTIGLNIDIRIKKNDLLGYKAYFDKGYINKCSEKKFAIFNSVSFTLKKLSVLGFDNDKSSWDLDNNTLKFKNGNLEINISQLVDFLIEVIDSLGEYDLETVKDVDIQYRVRNGCLEIIK